MKEGSLGYLRKIKLKIEIRAYYDIRKIRKRIFLFLVSISSIS